MRSSIPWLALLVVGGILVYCWRSNERAAPSVVAPNPLPIESEIESPLASAESDLAALRRSYREETSRAKRLRLQGRLAADLPTEQLMSEIKDPAAPIAYRSYLSRVFRNEVKRDAESYASLVPQLRQVVSSSEETFVARAKIARALIDIDASTDLVNSLESLLREASNDMEAVSVIRTLARSSHAKAANTLWAFVQSHHEDSAAYPSALAAAILPLSHIEDIPLTSVLNHLQARASDPTLLASVNKSLTARDPHRE